MNWYFFTTLYFIVSPHQVFAKMPRDSTAEEVKLPQADCLHLSPGVYMQWLNRLRAENQIRRPSWQFGAGSNIK